MAEKDLDDLFSDWNKVHTYCGSDEWRADTEKNKRARQIYKDLEQRVRNRQDCRENETRAQLAALGYTFDPWRISGWHK